MAIKALFAHAGLDYWLDVAGYLRERHGWEICYIQGHESQRGRAARLAPEAVFHGNDRCKQALPPEDYDALRPAALDGELLDRLSFNEAIFLKMMDRYDTDGRMTYQRRMFAYHRQMMLWKAVVELFQPDAAVFRIAPHMGFDYALYAMCRAMGVRTLMFERTAIPGRLFPVNSFETGSEPLRAAYQEILNRGEPSPDTGLSEAARAHLSGLKGSYDRALPFHTRYKMKNTKNKGAIGGRAGILYKTAVGTARAALARTDRANRVRREYFRNIGMLERKRLRRFYETLCRPVDLQRPFVFVALQCEPERQTCPVGGLYGHQYIMVDLLSKCAPPGWMIYVKEHISQFKTYQLAERARSLDFYRHLASLPNVGLVSLETVSFDLIDRAMASATVSGTVGWESVVRGKPAFLFGKSWYMDCRGVFKIWAASDLRAALGRVEQGFRPSEADVEAFVRAVEKVSTVGYIDRIYNQAGLIEPGQNTANLAAALDAHLRGRGPYDNENELMGMEPA